MKNRIYIFTIFILLFSSLFVQNSFGAVQDSTGAVQDSPESELEKIKDIYNNLEFDTNSFNLIKEKWIIIDHTLIRNIFNQFLVKNELKLKDKNLGPEYIKLFSDAISAGNVYANITKRYFDNEIERFSFSIKENTDSLIEKLKLYVEYSSGEIDPIPYSTSVNNSLITNNILINPTNDTIKNNKFRIEKIFNSLYNNHLLKVENALINNNFAKLYRNGIKNNKGEISIKTVTDQNNNVLVESLSFNLNSDPNLKNKLIFEGTQYLPDPIADGIYLEDIVGTDMYRAIKNKESHVEVSRQDFVTDDSYNFDINLNFFNPELMFWQSTTENVNKYLFSAFGKWGNDNIVVPGWFSSDYIAGAKLSYAKNVNSPTDSSYSIAIGSSFKGGFPFPEQRPEKTTFFSGRSIYFNLVGNPLNLLKSVNIDNFKIQLEGKIRIEESSYVDYIRPESKQKIEGDFFTVRNYLVFEAKKYDIFNFDLFDMLSLGKFEAGIGYSLLDIHHLDIDTQEEQVLNVPIPNGNQQHSAFLDIGIFRREGLFQHGISTMLNYNFTAKYGYATLKVMAMLNNTFGLDLRFSSGFVSSGSEIPIWRNESYFIFSPIIRINY